MFLSEWTPQRPPGTGAANLPLGGPVLGNDCSLSLDICFVIIVHILCK